MGGAYTIIATSCSGWGAASEQHCGGNAGSSGTDYLLFHWNDNATINHDRDHTGRHEEPK